ncbi:DUF5753 domain-containing protein [Streptomyces sp. NPDC050423]|uniref:DUF5753 domain-containing protein n=1 Tax=Streptomyces sp. NPDC050423 TaxID=3155402 RepID=UPI0034498AB5
MPWSNRPRPPQFCVVLSEAALRLQVGGAAVMRRQLEHLAKMTEHPSVEVRVVPDRAGAHAGLTGSFVLFSFPHSSITDVVRLEHRAGTSTWRVPTRQRPTGAPMAPSKPPH